MSRIGKIARLPKAVREELNRRLEDGEQQSRLVEWLNGRPEVQAVLKAEFDGRPINEPNMTAWAQGGFEDWRRQEESLEAAGRVVAETGAIAETMATGDRGRETGGSAGVASLVDRVAMMAALAIGEQFMAVRRMEEGDEKRRAVLKLVRGLVRLRKSDRECERGMREAAQAARAAEVHEDWAERMRPRSRADAPPSPGLWRAGREGMSEVRRKMTDVIARMSDEQIAESLQRSGYLPAAEAPKQVWWTDEDQAFEEAGLAEEEAAAKAEAAKEAASTLLRQGYGGQESKSTSMSTSVGAESASSVPCEGGTTSMSMSGHKAPPTVQTEPAGGGLIQS